MFRVALVGLGKASCTLHLPALARVPTATVVGAFDLDVSRRDQVAKKWHIPVFSSFDEMVTRTNPEVIVIGTPPESHAEYCLRSLTAGADVVCEKPFTSSLDEANQVISLANALGRRVALNHEFREMAIFRAIREAVATPESGDVIFAQAWQYLDLPPWAEPGWRGQMLQRSLYEAGVHLVDFLMVLFGEKPQTVSATVSTCGVRAGESDAVALATLEFSRGRLAQIVQNRLCKGEVQFFEIRAETGGSSLRASYGGRSRLTVGFDRSARPHVRVDFGITGLAWREIGTRREHLARNPHNPAMIATRDVLTKTLDAFRDGSKPPASAEEGRDVIEVIAACYQSAATGRRVRLDSGESQSLVHLNMGRSVVPAT
jgi:D-apiose dehydrogenase